MGKFIDKSGWIMKEHGVPNSRLTVLYRAPNHGKKVYWHVKCECGNELDVEGYSLNGNTLSCGCLHKERWRKPRFDLTGKRFGNLIALESFNRGNKVIWKCKCDCGKFNEVSSSDLLGGHSKSCGCSHLSTLDNLIGQTFGKLTVIEYAGSEKGRAALWKCKCECGNFTIVRANSLRQGITKSCGCLKSIGEENIIKILNNNNIKYIYDKAYFPDLQYKENGKLRYDFILLNKNNEPYRLIEFDGEQHLYGWGHDNKQFQEIKERDNIKNEYAHAHNIPLVRIPYKERDNITLDLIMGDKYEVN